MDKLCSNQCLKDGCEFGDKVFSNISHFVWRLRCEKLAIRFVFFSILIQFAKIFWIIGVGLQIIWWGCLSRCGRPIKFSYCMLVSRDDIGWTNKLFVLSDFIHQLLIFWRYHNWDQISMLARNLHKFICYTITMPRSQHYLAYLSINMFCRLKL